MGLSLTVLGTCGSYPGPGGACSGYLVRGEGTTLWVDAGSGTMANLQRHVSLQDVDAVILSHEHPDHWSDLEGFRVACAYVIEREGVPVYAPPGNLLRMLYKNFKMVLDWREVGDGATARIGGLDVSFSRTEHGPYTLAMRIDGGGKSLGYTADTGPGWSLSNLGPGLDLALCEATYTQQYEGVTHHLSGRQAGLTAKEAGVKRLLLTHFWPTLRAEDIQAEAVATFGGPVEIAIENEEYQL
jgi:ribonuclease BN (tRNA processing enzyme)